jgi:hypothetical protein
MRQSTGRRWRREVADNVAITVRVMSPAELARHADRGGYFA